MRHNEIGKVLIPGGVHPWPHELRVANILALAGHTIEFIPRTNTKTADILLDNVPFEIKSPKSSNLNTLEHTLKKALKQSRNIIIDTSRIKNARDDNICHFLINQTRNRKQIKCLIMISKQRQVLDISAAAK